MKVKVRKTAEVMNFSHSRLTTEYKIRQANHRVNKIRLWLRSSVLRSVWYLPYLYSFYFRDCSLEDPFCSKRRTTEAGLVYGEFVTHR